MLFNRGTLFLPFAGISLAYGLIVPSIFEWSQKPAARSRHPEMEWSALVVILLTALITLLIRFRGKPANQLEWIDAAKPSNRLQFNLRGMFVVTTLFAVLFVVAPMIELSVASVMVSLAVCGVLVHSFLIGRSSRARIGALLVSLFFPFAWVVLYNVPFGHTSGLVKVLPVGPAIVPAMFLSETPDGAGGFAAIFVMIELWVGSWLARRGGKLYFACLVGLLLFSGFNSFVLHSLYRM